jgi:hypothetical protein
MKKVTRKKKAAPKTRKATKATSKASRKKAVTKTATATKAARTKAAARKAARNNSGGFSAKYRSAFESIYGRLPKPSEGVPEQALAAAEKRLGGKLPAALRSFYATVGGTSNVTSAHNNLTPPDALSVEQGWVQFCDENQSVCDWWLRLDAGDDPNVEQRMDGSEDVGPCSEFLHYLIHLQALMGGLEHCGSRDRKKATVQKIQAACALACDKEGLAIYQRGGALIGCAEGADMLFAAARSEQDRAWLEQHLGFGF